MRLLKRIRKVDRCFVPLLIFALAFSILSMSSIPASAATGNETIASDQPEYMQGDTVFIFGSGFEPNHQIVVQVIRVDNSIVTGNGTETPGSDIITSDPYGSFIYPYLLDGGDTSVYYGILTVNAIDTSDMVTVLATTTFLDNPQVGLQGCSRERGDCTESVTPSTGWADGTNHMNGWTSGNVKGWYELENVPYRLRINPREPSDAKTYYFTVEHDNLKSGVTGVDGASEFYVGAGPDMWGYTEGTLTKNCVLQVNRLVGNNPTTSNPCIVTGPTYSGVDDDGNNGIDEDSANGIDNDGDGKVDEDPPPTSSTSGERRIQYTVAVLFTSSEVGHDKKWAIYWKAHLASGSSAWSGASLHAHTSIGGSQDVPIKNVLSPTGADLSITKSDSPDPVTAGGTLTYSITVTNNGPGTAKNVIVTDTLPGSVTLISAIPSAGSCSGTTTVICSLGTMANGSSVTISIDVTPNTAGTISNTATVSTTTTDPTSGNNTASASTTVNPNPGNNADLSINKTASPDPVVASGVLTYSITVTNLGPGAASNITVTDNLPGGVTNINASGSGWNCVMSGYLVTCSRSSLSVGSAPVITITVNAPSSGGTLNNTASVTATQNDPVSSNNTTTISTTVSASANLSITKTAFPDPVTAGGILTYTVTVANAGPSTATSVVVTDTLPAGTVYLGGNGTGWSCTTPSPGVVTVTCSRANLAVGTAPVLTISVTAPDEGGSISNTATVSSAVADPIPGNNNTGSVVTAVTASADLSITKTATPTVASGGTLTYTLAVTNNGPSTAANVSVADTLPSGVTYTGFSGTGWACSPPSGGVVTCTRSSLAAGAAPVIAIMVTAPVTAGPLTINNSATVSTSTNDPVPVVNNTSSASTIVNASADLSITKTGTSTVTVGGTLTYTLAVTNNGPSEAANVSVADTLPSGVTYTSFNGSGWTCTPNTPIAGVVTCTRNSSLAALATSNFTITATAPLSAGTITNSATVSASTNDPTPGNDSSSASTIVNAAPSADLLIVTNIDAPDPVTAGASLTYTITVLNNGPSTATSLTVTDYLPPGAAYVSASGSGWACGQSAGVVTCTSPSLTSGSTAPAITVTITAPFSVTSISSTATVSSLVTDPVPANNSKIASTTVNSAPVASADLAISKTDSPDPVTTGTALTYTVTVTNNGPDTANGVTVIDTLPGSVTYGSATPSQGSCTQASGTVNCPLGSLSNGAFATIAIVVTPTAAGTINNTASVSSSVSDPNMANNNASQGTTVNPPTSTSADLSVTNTDSPDPIPLVGQSVTYTIKVTNNGPSPATGVTVTDPLNLLTYVSVITTQGTCTGTTTVSCTIGTLSNSASATVKIVAGTNAPAGMISNTATVTLNETDPNMLNNIATATTNVGDVSRLLNISTRAQVGTGADEMIGGFIIGGSTPKPLLIRARGPSMSGAPFNISGTLSNPFVKLYSFATGTYIAQNDNWQVSDPLCQNSGYSCGGAAEITATGMDPCQPNPGQTVAPPNCSNESAMLITLPPGSYGAVVSGFNGGTGIGLVEVFDTDGSTLPKLVNISTRAKVLTGAGEQIGGFIIGAGTGNKQVLIRARGPSMSGAPFNISGTLANPFVKLYSFAAGTYIAQNDNWQTSDPLCATSGFVCGGAAEITVTGMDPCQPNPGQTVAPPNCSNEASILITLPPGSYGAVVNGVNGGTGVGLVEVFEVSQ